MQMNGDWFYQMYLNVRLFLTKYRKLEIKDDLIDLDEFQQKILINEYIQIDTVNNMTVLLFVKDTQLTVSKNLRSILQRISSNEIILIMDKLIKAKNKSTIKKETKAKLYFYKHCIFLVEIPLGPCVPKMRILSNSEITDVLHNMRTSSSTISKIGVEDPQAIWLGAKVNQMIESKGSSSNAIIETHYRVVVQTVKTNTKEVERACEEKEEDDEECEEIEDAENEGNDEPEGCGVKESKESKKSDIDVANDGDGDGDGEFTDIEDLGDDLGDDLDDE